MKIKVVCIQTTSSQEPIKNIRMLESALNDRKTYGADLICLPECVAIFSDNKEKINSYLLNWKSKFFELISEFAKKRKSFILIGSAPHLKKNFKFLNRSFLVNPKGLITSHYDKINLFDVELNKKEKYFESDNYDCGKRTSVTSLPWGKLGMTICYDLRFPNLYKKLAKKGADFFSIPAAFTYTTGISHWHALVRARAIENGCYVFAPAQCGKHDNGRKTYGNSMIVDPWGKVLTKAGHYMCIISYKIDLALISRSRKMIPAMTEFKL